MTFSEQFALRVEKLKASMPQAQEYIDEVSLYYFEDFTEFEVWVCLGAWALWFLLAHLLTIKIPQALTRKGLLSAPTHLYFYYILTTALFATYLGDLLSFNAILNVRGSVFYLAYGSMTKDAWAAFMFAFFVESILYTLICIWYRGYLFRTRQNLWFYHFDCYKNCSLSGLRMMIMLKNAPFMVWAFNSLMFLFVDYWFIINPAVK